MFKDTSGLNEDADSTGAPETRIECSVGVVTTVTAVEVVKRKHCASKYYNSGHLHPKSSRLDFLHKHNDLAALAANSLVELHHHATSAYSAECMLFKYMRFTEHQNVPKFHALSAV